MLANTRNEAALRVLLPALDSASAAVREGALKAILERRSPAGHREVLRRLHALDPRSEAIVRRHRARITQALRDAVLGADGQMCVNGCRAAVSFREYDLIPALVNALQDQSNPNRALAGKTLLELVDLLHAELAHPAPEKARRDPQKARWLAILALERSVQQFSVHGRGEVLQALLLLAGRGDRVLRQVLEDPHHPTFLAMVDVLSNSPAAGVMGLLAGFLEDPQAPPTAISVMARRSDPPFVRCLLNKVGVDPPHVVKKNLKRIESLAWLPNGTAVLGELDERAQQAAVRLVMTSGVPRSQAFAAVQFILLHGKPWGRRAAGEALNEFRGAEANALAVQALEDQDPEVQANVLVQLRSRGILGALPRLVKMVDSPHAVVQQAVRESLAEFNFQRFLAAFDVLDEEVRRSTGTLVKKVDPQTIPRLRAELESPVRSRRLRALAVATAIDAVGSLRQTIVGMLQDREASVRAEAARALGQRESRRSWKTWHGAFDDQGTAVQGEA